MFHEASKALAKSVSTTRLEQGYIYPDVSDIRDVSATVAAAVVLEAIESGLADRTLREEFYERNIDLKEYVTERMWQPKYVSNLVRIFNIFSYVPIIHHESR
jgi:malic enzyme